MTVFSYCHSIKIHRPLNCYEHNNMWYTFKILSSYFSTGFVKINSQSLCLHTTIAGFILHMVIILHIYNLIDLSQSRPCRILLNTYSTHSMCSKDWSYICHNLKSCYNVCINILFVLNLLRIITHVILSYWYTASWSRLRVMMIDTRLASRQVCRWAGTILFIMPR